MHERMSLAEPGKISLHLGFPWSSFQPRLCGTVDRAVQFYGGYEFLIRLRRDLGSYRVAKSPHTIHATKTPYVFFPERDACRFREELGARFEVSVHGPCGPAGDVCLTWFWLR